MLRILSIVALFTAVALPAMAEEGYGPAGCGLGSVVFGAKKGNIQILAATTNGTFGSQTFGISTGTSNCEDKRSAAGKAEAFIADNQKALEKDAARGQGETVENLASIMGCKDSASLGTTLQANYGKIFNSSKVANNVLSTVRNTPELAASCSI